MNRRNFLKKSALALSSLASISLLETPLMAYDMNKSSKMKTQENMKMIIIIDGGPRRNMNTAQMLQKFAEGAKLEWRDAHWEEYLQKAFDAGRQMADR